MDINHIQIQSRGVRENIVAAGVFVRLLGLTHAFGQSSNATLARPSPIAPEHSSME